MFCTFTRGIGTLEAAEHTWVSAAEQHLYNLSFLPASECHLPLDSESLTTTAAMGGAVCRKAWYVHMQVIPFLVLAVGVDNMFILAHALQQQDHSLPIPERLGHALAGAGPSITLAAACETLAFGLGGLTSMPAVRNFSLCAAVAVLLDYALQVSLCSALNH